MVVLPRECGYPVIPAAREPKPFLKWVGGKRRSLKQFASFFPKEFGSFHEPFLGGAAVFFHLKPCNSILSDINHRLINAYQAIRDDVVGVIDVLEQHRCNHNKEYFYQCREAFNQADGFSSVELAGLFIYLNKTCFNGLYRENSRGRFNVPIGQYKNPQLYNLDNLVAVHRYLQQTELHTSSFEAVLDRAVSGDFVYFDPPYVPISATSSFTSYNRNGFDVEMHQKLADVFGELVRKGCYVMLSNSNCEYVVELYKEWHQVKIYTSRSINSRSDRRGACAELLILGC